MRAMSPQEAEDVVAEVGETATGTAAAAAVDENDSAELTAVLTAPAANLRVGPGQPLRCRGHGRRW